MRPLDEREITMLMRKCGILPAVYEDGLDADGMPIPDDGSLDGLMPGEKPWTVHHAEITRAERDYLQGR